MANLSNPKKILIVEDEKTLVQALEGKLKYEGFVVTVAVNGEIGLAKALADHPDLILLDLVMPTMDGLTMLKQLRADEWGKQAKIIVLTNLLDANKAEESLQHGVPDYLIKTNWKLGDLVKQIRAKLDLDEA